MKRNFGLDLCRALAIVMVLISHSRNFFSKYFYVDYLGINGFLAVELFFVLSGFLIGKIIINELIDSDVKQLKNFYFRRWFRTLPAYYIVVLILSFYKKLNFQTLIFFQNFKQEWLNFFPVSWSLSVEEWFYLIVPFIYFIFAKSKKSFFNICYIIIIFSLILRIVSFFIMPQSWDFGTRQVIYLRLDSLVVGVLFAGIKYYNNKIYNIIFSKRQKLTLFITLVCFILFITSFYLLNRDESFYARTFMFTIISFIFISFVCLTEMTRFNINKKVLKIVTFLSLTSYSVYLIHLEFLSFIYQKYNNSVSLLGSIVLVTISLFLTYICSYIIYRYIEQPFMRLRDKMTL